MLPGRKSNTSLSSSSPFCRAASGSATCQCFNSHRSLTELVVEFLRAFWGMSKLQHPEKPWERARPVAGLGCGLWMGSHLRAGLPSPKDTGTPFLILVMGQNPHFSVGKPSLGLNDIRTCCLLLKCICFPFSLSGSSLREQNSASLGLVPVSRPASLNY